MKVIETPLRLFCELALDGSLTGHYQQEFQRRVEDDDGAELMSPQTLIKDLTPEVGAAILASGAAAKAAEIQVLSKQIADMQAEAAALAETNRAEISKLQQTIQNHEILLKAVADANAAWDSTVGEALDKTGTP